MPRTAGSQNQENLKYQKLYNWGRTLITSGVIKNQDKFPSEHILQKKFGYSRQTVRNALDRLEKDGLIVRKQRRRWRTPPCGTDLKLLFGLSVSAGLRGN